MRLLGLSLLIVVAAGLPARAQTTIPKAATITTSKGDFQVPGRAFLDGSDPESRPPVIRLSIPLLQSAVSTHAVCQVEHSTQVDLLEVQRHVEKKQYYFRVRVPRCDGWVPETALSTKKVPTTGDGRRR